MSSFNIFRIDSKIAMSFVDAVVVARRSHLSFQIMRIFVIQIKRRPHPRGLIEKTHHIRLFSIFKWLFEMIYIIILYFNRYRRGLETCPQANLVQSVQAIFFFFFPPRPSDEYDSAPSRNHTAHFGAFSPVSVKVFLQEGGGIIGHLLFIPVMTEIFCLFYQSGDDCPVKPHPHFIFCFQSQNSRDGKELLFYLPKIHSNDSVIMAFGPFYFFL